MRIPMLMDHHNHFFVYSMLSDSLNLQTIRTKEEALGLIAEKTGKDVSVVLGWNDRVFRFSQREIDALPPLVICNISLHGFMINAAARDRLGERDPEIMKHIDDDVWREKNLTRVLGFLASVKPLEPNKIIDFASFLELKGIWASHDMFVCHTGFLELIQGTALAGRVVPWTDLSTFEALSPRLRDPIRGIKIFTDGALGPRTAALKAPYRNGSEGLLNYSPAGLREVIEKALTMRDAVAIHAIGDLAIGQVLDNLPDGVSGTGKNLIRMEHGQFISLENALRAREKGVVLCMQPNFSSDSTVYSDRLPDGYPGHNNPFRMLIDRAGFVPGETLFFGSDGMPHGIGDGLRQALFPGFPGQRLTLDEFVAGYCWENTEPGHIEIEINQKERKVLTKVVLNHDR